MTNKPTPPEHCELPDLCASLANTAATLEANPLPVDEWLPVSEATPGQLAAFGRRDALGNWHQRFGFVDNISGLWTHFYPVQLPTPPSEKVAP